MEGSRPKTTQSVRISFDIELDRPHDAYQLKVLGSSGVKVLQRIAFVTDARWTQIVPAEADFDWQGQ